jgi:hypothetical protein
MLLLQRSPIGWRTALALATGAAVGASIVALATRARTRAARAPAAARQTALLATDRAAVTRSVALAIDELIAATRASPSAHLLTASMAVAIDAYETSASLPDPEKRRAATLEVLDLMLQLERRIQEVRAPWYVRHDKPVAFAGALGSAAAIWLGLSQDLLGQLHRPDSVIRGCPSAPIAPGTRVVLEAERARSLVWSLDGRELLVGATFRWPLDAGRPPSSGTYVVRAAAAGESPRALCVIEVRE